MERTSPKQVRFDKAGPKVVEALKARRFDAYYAGTKEEALSLALSLIPREHVVSFGGSQTADTLGIIKALKAVGNEVIDRANANTPNERYQMMRRALLSDTYIMGCNAISEDGILINVDGNGNRVGALTFGPDSVIVLVGMNKLCKDRDAAYQRARTIAAPTNSQRFPINTPCKIDGVCHNCSSPDCICNVITEVRGCRPAGRIKVILIGEELGM